jgi:hypothetical protein
MNAGGVFVIEYCFGMHFLFYSHIGVIYVSYIYTGKAVSGALKSAIRGHIRDISNY